ncbi:hypothetical protein N431DRAFT_550611 [Stipitochalara longipes BDJ]|nr:hypothetical protein N431DRAFT_550611 [Stipitochalara longipes BDJ]
MRKNLEDVAFDMEAPTSLRVLCLDGGGIKGYTSLLILRRIFRTIAAEGGLQEPPRPCDMFDLIAGTSTGGLIAVMLGRLHMSVDECITVYENLGKEVFGKRLIGGQFGRIIRGMTSLPFYDIEALQAQVKKVLKEKGIALDELFVESNTPICKVILCATRMATSTADVFRNYESHHPTSENYTCQIWEAASATAAAPMFFRSISCEPNWEGKQIGCVLSLGTGIARTNSLSSNLASFLKGSIKIMTDAEDTAKVFAASAVGKNLMRTHRYFRFNIPQGMEDLQLDEWKATDRMRALTTEYLSHVGIGDTIQQCAKTLLFPDENPYSDRLRKFFTPNMKHQQIFALWGLAGVGKTQIALEFAQSMTQRLSVYWVRADSLANFIADYSQILGMLDVTNSQPLQSSDSPSLLKQIGNRLEETSGEWLLILDNADHLDQFMGTGNQDNSISISQYIPRRGRILITTRDRRFQGSVVAAASNGLCVDLMSAQEAESLLLKSVPQHLVQQNLANVFMAKELVDELGYLPLAIAQAAANILGQQLSFAEYLMRRPAFDFANRDPRNGTQSVHVTWAISLDVLKEQAPLSLDVPQLFLRALPEFKASDAADFLRAAKRPLSLSLIEQVDDEMSGMTTYMDTDERKRYVEPTILLMSNIFPYKLAIGTEQWSLATFLFPHVARHVEIAQETKCSSQSLALLMFRLSCFYGQSSMLEAGAEVAVESVKMASELWDPEGTMVFYFRKNNLERLNGAARYPDAEEEATILLKLLEAPAIVEQLANSLEKQRIEITSSFSVTLRGMRGKRFDELEVLHRGQLQSEHIDPWSSHGIVARHNLAHTLLKRGQVEEATEINNELLEFCETKEGILVVGKRLHLIMLNLRALIIRSGSNFDQRKEEVLQIYNRVFRESQDYLGVGEVDTWIATNNICGILLQLDQMCNMEHILWETITRAIATKIKIEGKFDTSMVGVYHKAGEYSEYLDSHHGVNSRNSLEFKELLEAWRFTSRLDNATNSPSSQIEPLNNIGVYRQRRGQYDEAEQYHIQALELCEIHGMHDVIPLLRYNQMLAIGRSGRISEAEAYRQQFLDIIVQQEAIYGSLERRMIEFEDDKRIYLEAKEMIGKGAMTPNDPWFQDNIKKIRRAEDRYGELFSQTV